MNSLERRGERKSKREVHFEQKRGICALVLQKKKKGLGSETDARRGGKASDPAREKRIGKKKPRWGGANEKKRVACGGWGGKGRLLPRVASSEVKRKEEKKPKFRCTEPPDWCRKGRGEGGKRGRSTNAAEENRGPANSEKES